MGYERNDRRYSGDRDRDDRYRGYRNYGPSSYDNRDQGYYGSAGDRDRSYGTNDRYRSGGGDRDYGRDQDQDRGFFERAGDEVRSWFGDEEAERRRREDDREHGQAYGRDDEARRRSDARSGGAFAGGGWGGSDRHGSGYGGEERLRGTSSRYGQSDYGQSGQGRSGYEPSRYGQSDRGRSVQDAVHDPHYREWRDRQIESLDRDYHEYRQHNQSRFENEFSSWRQNRQSQRDSLRQVKEHDEVLGSDGEHLGTVDHVRGDQIKLTKNDQAAGGHHHTIPSAWISRVEDGKVTINKTAAEARRQWTEVNDDQDRGGLFGRDEDVGQQRNLNRSFSGTY